MNVTQGSGTVIGADEVTINSILVKLQRIKLACGTDGNYQQDFALGAAAKSASVSVTLATDEDKANLLTTFTAHKAVEVLEAENYTFYEGTAYPLLFAKFNVASSGDNQVVAAHATKKTRVVGYYLSFSGTANAKWRNGTTDISDLHYGVANTLSEPPIYKGGYFETSSNTALNLNLSAAVNVAGWVLYFQY